MKPFTWIKADKPGAPFKRFLVFGGQGYRMAGGWDDFLTSTSTFGRAKALSEGRDNGGWLQIVDTKTGEVWNGSRT